MFRFIKAVFSLRKCFCCGEWFVCEPENHAHVCYFCHAYAVMSDTHQCIEHVYINSSEYINNEEER